MSLKLSIHHATYAASGGCGCCHILPLILQHLRVLDVTIFLWYECIYIGFSYSYLYSTRPRPGTSSREAAQNEDQIDHVIHERAHINAACSMLQHMQLSLGRVRKAARGTYLFFSPPGEGGSKNPLPHSFEPRFESRRPDAAKWRLALGLYLG